MRKKKKRTTVYRFETPGCGASFRECRDTITQLKGRYRYTAFPWPRLSLSFSTFLAGQESARTKGALAHDDTRGDFNGWTGSFVHLGKRKKNEQEDAAGGGMGSSQKEAILEFFWSWV